MGEDLTKTWSTAEAAKILGVANRTIQLWVESGHLQAWKTVGGHRRILASSLEVFLNNRSQPYLAGNNAKKSASEKQRSSQLIFVCDSDQNMRALFRKYANDWDGVQWKFFKCPFEALIGIGEKCPDIFICEMCPPGLDIVHMVKKLRDHPSSLYMKLILISDLTENTLEAFNFPPDLSVLKKPFSIREGFNIINNELNSLPDHIKS